MTFDHPWALLAGRCCRSAGQRGSGGSLGRRLALVLKAGTRSGHHAGAVRAAADGLREQGGRGHAGGHFGQRYRRKICSANRTMADAWRTAAAVIGRG